MIYGFQNDHVKPRTGTRNLGCSVATLRPLARVCAPPVRTGRLPLPKMCPLFGEGAAGCQCVGAALTFLWFCHSLGLLLFLLAFRQIAPRSCFLPVVPLWETACHCGPWLPLHLRCLGEIKQLLRKPFVVCTCASH